MTGNEIVDGLPRPTPFALAMATVRRRMVLADAWVRTLDGRIRQVAQDRESGLATAEYAVVMIGATAFAGVLVAILKSGTVKTLLTNIVKQALSVT